MAMRKDYRRAAPQNNILSVNSTEGRLTEELDITTRTKGLFSPKETVVNSSPQTYLSF